MGNTFVDGIYEVASVETLTRDVVGSIDDSQEIIC